MKNIVAVITICLFLSGCAVGVMDEMTRTWDALRQKLPRPADETGLEQAPADTVASSQPMKFSPKWEFDLKNRRLEPTLGLPISSSYVPFQHDILTADNRSLDSKKPRRIENGTYCPPYAPERLEVLTTPTERPLPLEEPEPPEDLVVHDVPSFLERGEGEEGDGLGLSPLAELEKEMVHDIPMVKNAYVQKYLEYFQNGMRKHMERWLSRSHRYLPMITNILAEQGLPEDLVYMAMIESGFNPKAYSRAHAVGMWQFIEGTAKKYGLRVDWWVDERRDPEKATRAAIAYLKDLYEMFGSWYLAAASYNAGERRISQEVDTSQTSDFWTLAEISSRLKHETKSYVPKLLAAVFIAKNPGEYGFTGIEPEEPLRYDRVLVQGSIDLRVLAKACGTTYEELKELNPELKHWLTPPDCEEYCLKVPENSGIRFYTALASMKPLEKVTFGGYVVKRRDTLSLLARQFGTTAESIAEANRISKSKPLTPGQKLFIPGKSFPDEKSAGLATSRTDRNPSQSRNSRSGSPAKDVKLAQSEKTKIHVLQKGQTLWDVARKYSVPVNDLMKLNKISSARSMKPGTRLRIPVAGAETGVSASAAPAVRPRESTAKQGRKPQSKEILYTVRKGDNFWVISQKYGIGVDQLLKWNGLTAGKQLYPGDKLRLIVTTEI